MAPNERHEVALRSKIVKGLKFPYALEEEAVLSALNYKPRSDDIFVISYPKCGSTWTQQILYLLFNKGEPAGDFVELFISCPFLDITGAEFADIMPRPGNIKLHTPYHLTPRSDSAKYVVVARNPKDCCVSFYYHTKKQVFSNFENGTFDDFFELFIRGENDYGDYFDHLLSWYPHRHDPNVLFLTYEEMKGDLRPVIYRIAEFLGPHWVKTLQNEPEIVDKVIQGSTVDTMRDPINKGLLSLFLDKSVPENIFFPKSFRNIVRRAQERGGDPMVIELVRKGIVGDWRNHFTQEQNRRMNERIALKTKGSDVMDLWKDIDLGL